MKKSPPQAFSVNQLSKLTGADRRTVDKAVVGLEPGGKRGKAKLYVLSDVEAALKARRPAAGLRDQKLEQEIRRLRLANDKQEGTLISVKTVATKLQELSAGQLALLRQRLENEAPSQIADLKDPAAVRVILKRTVDEVCEKMRALVKDWTC